MKRKFTLTLEPVAGAINMFYAFLNGKRIIADEGTKKRKWEGEIETDEVRIKVRVTGIGSSKYKVTIDLPGTAKDQKLTFQLKGGYHEFEMYI
jgi:uncharacterized beta-barrel protein YwiB (DUF1934 family)